MAARKRDTDEPAFDYDQAYAELLAQMEGFHISRISEMPRIELYRDQVLSIVSAELGPLYDEHEKIVTGAMVNNYVKQKIVPAPVRKRYTRRHLATVLFVCTLKRVLSISQIAQLILLCGDEGVNTAAGFDEFERSLEEAVRRRFPVGGQARTGGETTVSLDLVDTQGQPITGRVRNLLESSIALVADKVYVDKMLALEERRALAPAE